MRKTAAVVLQFLFACSDDGAGAEGGSSGSGADDGPTSVDGSASATADETASATGSASVTVSTSATSDGSGDATSPGDSSGDAESSSTGETGSIPDGLQAGWITYLGGSLFEHVRDLAFDGNGRVHATGGGSSTDLATTAGVFQPQAHPGPPAPGVDPFDVFVFAYEEAGSIAWATYLGGPQYDRAYAIEVDATGVYVAGRAGAGFPVTAGAAQTSFQGGQEAAFYGEQDGFVCKLELDASDIQWCTYFGGTDARIVRDIAVDSTGAVYVASGYSSGSYTPAVADAFVNSPFGGEEAVLAKIAADGGSVVWARYIGGSGDDEHQNSVRVDSADNPYILVTTASADAETSKDAYDTTYGGSGDLYVLAAQPEDGAFRWATFLGGSANESTETHEFAVDAAGECYVAGPTSSMDFPTTPGAFDDTFGGGNNDMFAARISADGTTLVGATFIGGNGSDRPEGVAVGTDGSIYLTGTTTSPDFPVTADAHQAVLAVRDAVVVRVAPDFGSLLYSSYLGGSGEDYGRGATVDGQGRFWLGGEVHSMDLAVHNAAQPAYGGGTGDAFVALFTPAP